MTIKDPITASLPPTIKKVQAVREEYQTGEIIRVVVTHFATKGALKKAQEQGIIVVQSFEW